MQARDLFVQMLGQQVDAGLVVFALGPQFNCARTWLVEGCRHHEDGGPWRCPRLEAPLGQQDSYGLPEGHFDHIHLRSLMLVPFCGFFPARRPEFSSFEMADIDRRSPCSFIFALCSMRITSLLPVVVMKMSAVFRPQSSSVSPTTRPSRLAGAQIRVDFGHFSRGRALRHEADAGRAFATCHSRQTTGDL